MRRRRSTSSLWKGGGWTGGSPCRHGGSYHLASHGLTVAGDVTASLISQAQKEGNAVFDFLGVQEVDDTRHRGHGFTPEQLAILEDQEAIVGER